MSDATTSPTAPTAPTAPTGASQPQPRRSRWRRRLIIGLVTILAIVVCLRVILVVALPSVLRKAAARYDLNCDYERTEMYLISGNVGVWHLKLTPKSGGDPLLAADYLRADVSALNLLRGRLVVYHLEGDGVDVMVDRDEHGEFPLLKHVMLASAAPAPHKTDPAAPRDINLDSPVRIDLFRGSHVRARLRDRSVVPQLDTTLDVNVRLADVGSLKRPTQFNLSASSPDLLDILQIQGTGTARGKAVDARMQINCRGIHLKPAAGYLAALGLRPSGDSLSLRMTATVKGEPLVSGSTTKPSGMTGAIVLSDISAVADDTEAAGLDKLTIPISDLSPGRIKLGKVEIENVRGRAMRTREGVIRVAGIDLVGAPSSTSSPAQSPAQSPTQSLAQARGPSPSPRAVSPMPSWSMDELSVRNVKLNFEDDAVTPAAALAVDVENVSIKQLSSDDSQTPTEVSAEMAVPGVARRIHVSGVAVPLAAQKMVDLKVIAEGVKPDALRPYLDAAGLESQLKNATFSCDLRASAKQASDGTLSAEAKLANIKFTDGADLFAFEGLALAGATIDPAANRVRFESIEIVGPSVTASRDKAGWLGAMGFVQKPIAAPANVAQVAPAPAAPAHFAPTRPMPVAVASTTPAAALPAIEIGRLTWKGARLNFDDQAVSPPVSIALTDSGIEVTNLHIDLDSKSPPAAPGKFRAWLSAPGVVGKLALTGTIAPSVDGLALDLDLVGQNLRAGPVSAYLEAVGIKPELRDGSVQMHTTVAIARRNDELSADVALSGVTYSDSGQEIAGLDGLRITGATLKPDGIAVGEIVIDKPRAKAMRDDDGTFVLGGVRLIATTQSTAPAPATAPSTVAAAGKPPVIMLGKLRINDAKLSWIDRAVARPVDAQAIVNLNVDNFVLGKPADPAKLLVTMNVPSTLEALTASGVISVEPNAPLARLDVAATGIQAGWLASYLPPGMAMKLADGRLHVKLDAGASPVKQGGHQIHLLASDFEYRDGEAGEPLLRFESARVIASRVDPVGGKVIAIDELSLTGLETEARKMPDGTIRALGLAIGPPPPESSAAGNGIANQSPALQTAPAGAVVASGSVAPSAAPTTNVAELIAKERAPLPLITLAKLDVNLRKVSYIDASRPESSPIALADVRVFNRKPIDLLGPDAQSRAPVEIELTGRIDPLVQTFNVAVVTAPFASQPTLVVDVSATGIKGDGLAAIAPELKPRLDGSGLTEGRFSTHVEATAKFSRRGPAQYDFGKPFDAEFIVRPLEFRASDGGPVLAGLEEIRGEGIRVDPATGGVSVRTLEITKPIGDVWRDHEGIHALGVVFKITREDATTQPPPPPAVQPSLALQTAPPVQPAGEPVTKPAEKRIDRLLISGIEFKFEDRTTDPGLLVPLNNLDVEVRDLTNLALYEPRPIRFSVLAGAGKVPLSGKGERDLFAEAAAHGNLSLFPTTRGWVKSSVSGFEMVSLYGPAKANGVQIGGGVFDGTVDLRLKDDGSLDTYSRLAVTDLKVSEPPDGPIRRTLQLPAPLDAVILVLQDASGAITVPLHVPVEHGEVSTGAVVGSATGAFASIVATALASSPLKVAGGVTSIIGLGPKEKETGSRPAGAVDFAAADTGLSPEAQAQINALLEELRRKDKLQVTLKHELGAPDLARVAILANPSPDDCAAIAEQIRARKRNLLQSRQALATTARGQLASGASAAARVTLEELRGVDRQLAAAEDALDRVYELLRPGADRQADRRTRAAALVVAEQRLNAVRDALLAAGGPKLEPRVRLTRAEFTEPEQPDTAGRVTFTVLEKKKP